MTANLIAGDRVGMRACLPVIVHRPIDLLKPDPGNARKHSKKQIGQIARSIRTFGFNVPVLVDANLRVIAGHGRLLAARQLGLSDVPTISLEHLSPEQARAFAIADNRLTEIATWDDRLLGEQLRGLSELNLDFDLQVTGFEIGEIDFLIQGPAAEADPDDDVPRQEPGPAVCRPGDLWQLGRHRIYCGSAIEEQAYRVLMAENRAAAVFTDPLYSVAIDRYAGGLGAIQHREYAVASGEMDPAALVDFLAQACGLLAQYSRDGSLHYLCMNWRHAGELLAAATPVYAELKDLCVWAKQKPGMGPLYRNQHEFVFVFKHGPAPHRNNVRPRKHGRDRSNLWSYPDTPALVREEGNRLALHPAAKPVQLVADALLDCTTRGEIVLDGFLGSGTTLIAAERIGRVCRGLEIDPLYVDTAIRRWQAHSGEHAIHTETGRHFDQIDPDGRQDT